MSKTPPIPKKRPIHPRNLKNDQNTPMNRKSDQNAPVNTKKVQNTLDT